MKLMIRNSPSHTGFSSTGSFTNQHNLMAKRADNCSAISWSILFCIVLYLSLSFSCFSQIEATVLMRVCDTKDIKAVTNKVCMLYKRTKNAEIRMDRQGNIRITRGTKGDISPAKLASVCCKIGCPPHIFADNC